jgi:predicted nucleic acid-binding protein
VAEVFVDTNVLLYLVSADSRKAGIAEATFAGGNSHLSVQVLNEFVAVARKKAGLSWTEIDEALGIVRQVCRVHPLTLETHDAARALARKHRLNIYDASILASALQAGCDVLCSEDFQDGQRFGGVMRVRNPFR